MAIQKLDQHTSISIERFKIWVLRTHKTPWHTLSDETLTRAMDDWNNNHPNFAVERFWY